MMAWPHNVPPHRNALIFDRRLGSGLRIARHPKGQWQVFPRNGKFRAWRVTVGSNADLGTYPTEGLAMSACAKDCKDQP